MTPGPTEEPSVGDGIQGQPFRRGLMRALRIAARDPSRVPSLASGRVAEQLRARSDLWITDAILSRLPLEGDGLAGWRIDRVVRSGIRTGVTVVIARPTGGTPRLAIKLPHSDAGTASLRRQFDVLAELHHDRRLVEWSVLVPRPVVAGRIRCRQYFVESIAPGRLIPSTATERPVHAAAAAAIGDLHRRTAARIQVDNSVLEQWVGRPIRVLSGAELALGGGTPAAATLALLQDRLEGALKGRGLQVSWIHGDFWRGNLLVGTDGNTVTGIIDWDRAAPAELPAHDLFHLLLHRKKEVMGRGALDITALIKGHDIWGEEERALLGQARKALPDDGVADDVMALLYWLRHTAATMTLYPQFLRDRAYLSADVEPILRVVAEAQAP